MSHRAALYRVQIRPKNDVNDYQLLGDYDEAGTWAGETVDNILAQLRGTSRDKKVQATFDASLPDIDMNYVGVSILSGRTGVTSVLARDGERPFLRTPDHAEAMRTAVLFYLPPDRVSGWMAVHVPHGRSCKGIVENALKGGFSSLGFVIELGAIVPPNALREAVARDAVEKITLIKHEPNKSDRFQDAAQWGDDEVDRIELSIPSRRRMRLRRHPLERFLDEPNDENRRQIIEFAGLVFDEASVTVDMPEGGQRTFFLETREGGHPMTLGIDINTLDEYGATGPELSAELHKALKTVGGGP